MEGEDANPPATAPASLLDGEGRCRDLGPAPLEVTSAEVTTDAEDDAAPVSVSIALTRADTGHFEQLTSEHLGQQLAVVVFGRVQTAPMVHAVIDSGSILIPGLDEATAERIVENFA